MHASCESPCHLSAKRCLLDTCFLLTAPFRTMLLTARGGPRCLGPKAYGVPVHLIAFLHSYFALSRRTVSLPHDVPLVMEGDLTANSLKGKLATQPFVAHKTWLRSGESPHCFRANLVKTGGYLRCLFVHRGTNFGLLQTPIKLR